LVSAPPALALSGLKLYLYDSQLQQIGSIDAPGGVGAVAIDKAGDIYHDCYCDYTQKVYVYNPPYIHKPHIVSLYSEGYARGIAVDWKTGIFAVVTDPLGPNYNAAVTFFRHGATKPCAVVQAPNGWYVEVTSAAFDAEGNLFTAFLTGSKAFIASVSGECSASSFVTYTPLLNNPYRLQFNSKDQLVIGFYRSGPIVTYEHPANGKLGKVVSTTAIDKLNGQMTDMMVLSSDGKGVWAANFNNEVGLYPYPAGGAPTTVIKQSSVGAAAVYPQLQP